MKNPVIVIILALSALALGLGLWSWQQWQHDYQPALAVSTKFDVPRALPDFTLQDMQGQPYTRESLKGRWHLLFFGYTHCPDVCPNTLALLASVKKSLGKDAPRAVLVSLDPARDSPARLKEYVPYFDPDFLGVTGTPDALASFTRALHVPYIVGQPDADGRYDIEHSGSLVLVSPEGFIVGYLSPPFTAAQIVDDLRKMLRL